MRPFRLAHMERNQMISASLDADIDEARIEGQLLRAASVASLVRPLADSDMDVELDGIVGGTFHWYKRGKAKCEATERSMNQQRQD